MANSRLNNNLTDCMDQTTHSGMKSYTCMYCKKSFGSSSHCKQHERTHTGEKPFTCKHCKKSFSRLSTCKQHERTHTGEKPFTCKYCNKCFSVSSNCKRHERTHTGEKPYSCKHCNKCFSSLANCKKHEQHCQCLKLRRHLQQPTTTHGSKKDRVVFSSTEENLIQVESLTCWICQEEFSRKACLIKHYDDHMRWKRRWCKPYTLLSRILVSNNFDYELSTTAFWSVNLTKQGRG